MVFENLLFFPFKRRPTVVVSFFSITTANLSAIYFGSISANKSLSIQIFRFSWHPHHVRVDLVLIFPKNKNRKFDFLFKMFHHFVNFCCSHDENNPCFFRNWKSLQWNIFKSHCKINSLYFLRMGRQRRNECSLERNDITYNIV